MSDQIENIDDLMKSLSNQMNLISGKDYFLSEQVAAQKAI